MVDVEWPELERAARRARSEGGRCVVGAVVVNPAGQVFLQRRAPHVRLFPGGWDIIGGHVEPGESLAAALAREVLEETGWRLAAVQRVVRAFDWTGADGQRRWEVDLLAEVDGDLTRPRIERDKFDDARWFDEEQLRVLRSTRPDDDAAMIDIALAGLEMLSAG